MPRSQAYSPKHPDLDMDRQMQLVSLIEFSPQFPPAITLPLMTATHSSELEDSSSQPLILGHLFSVVKAIQVYAWLTLRQAKTG